MNTPTLSIRNKGISRVLIVGPVLTIPPSDGSMVRIFEFARHLSKAGLEITLLTMMNQRVDDIQLENFNLVHFSLARARTKISYLAYIVKWHIIATSLGVRQVLKEKPHLIICETLAPSVVTFILARIARVPWILDVHSTMSKRLSSAKSRPNMSFVLKIFEDVSFSLANAIFAASLMLQKMLIKKGLGYKTFYLPSGVDTSRFHSHSHKALLAEKKEKYFITFVGPTLNRANRLAIEELYEVGRCILESNPKVEFRIIGRGPPLLPIPSNFTYTGYVTNLEDYLADTDIAVLPYVEGTQEGIPVKLLEYLASGKPIVCTAEAIRSLPELVSGENCIVARDRAEFVAAILMLLEKDGIANKISENAGRLAKQYDWEKITHIFLHHIGKFPRSSSTIAANNVSVEG